MVEQNKAKTKMFYFVDGCDGMVAVINAYNMHREKDA